MQYTRERDPQLLELNVYYGEQISESYLYEDPGEGFTHNEGNYRLTTFQFESDPQKKTVRLTADREGTFVPAYDTVKINLIGLPFEPEGIEADGRSFSPSEDQGIYTFETDPDFTTVTVY